ncbi:MAG TPA: aminomethyl-transferring glycine dehydrogenase subunit GcvPB [bacterium]|nr:aminomethyl-transferring glycine dehydrogenase subunit GcvPB [bacterium]
MKVIFDYKGNNNPEKIFGVDNEIPLKSPDAKYLTAYNPDFNGLNENIIARHYLNLSQKNHCVDKGFYPLGSCTMKYNPKINEELSAKQIFNIHPETAAPPQYLLKILYELSEYLCKITGLDAVTLQPVAGAHGEYTGLKIIKKYFSELKENRDTIIVPDNSHGTNPASAALLGYKIIQIKSDENGYVSIPELKKHLSQNVAALMLTNPNTLGLFEKNILEISEILHKNNSLLYCDGANMNAILGKCRPGDMGFDVTHLNLHKTFSTPHGAGGPGAGPVAIKNFLKDYLPVPFIKKNKNNEYYLDYSNEKSIGSIHSYYGNINVLLKAYFYIKILGANGLNEVSDIAVLNANYLKSKLSKYYFVPYNQICKHEFVINNKYQKECQLKTLDIVKRLMDFGIHPPTIYFPLIVDEAMMIEPTETETLETLNEFISAMIQISEECKTSPELIKSAPHNTPVRRVNETLAARNPVVNYFVDK